MLIRVAVVRHVDDDTVQACVGQFQGGCEHTEALEDDRLTKAVHIAAQEVIRLLMQEVHWTPQGTPPSDCPIYLDPLES